MANISGPNFSMISTPTELLSTLDLLNNKEAIQYSGSSSSPFASLKNVAYATSLVSQSGVDLGTDFSNYSNFVHFGSAQERLSHFKDKLEDLEFHETTAITLSNNISAAPSYQSESVDFHINAASTIIEQFDGYDRYLYFITGSTSWPKDASNNPLHTTSSAVTSWYSNQLEVAEDFDLENQNRILNTLPDYIKEDSANDPAIIFSDMLGHHYDNLLVYADGISQKHNTDNRLNVGASRDLIGDILRGFGIKLYSSQFNSNALAELYTGTFFPTGSEVIVTSISGSDTIPSTKDHLDEVYKRIYHNIAYLLQVKGTKRGLRALINTFGVPSDVLPIKEYGGVDGSGLNFGPDNAITSSVDKIRLDNTGSLIDGKALSRYVETTTFDSNYSKDLHIVEIGWSQTNLKDDYIKGEVTASYNIDEYIGDPRDRFKLSYTDLSNLSKDILDTSEDRTIYDFLRLLKYYDNQMFAMLEDFAPARTTLRKGAIIKPHLLERSKADVGRASVTEEQYSGSIEVYAVTGSEGDVINQDTSNAIVNKTIAGAVSQSILDQRERFNGELGGSSILVSNGELNDENPLKRLQPLVLDYDVEVETDLDTFRTTPVSAGELAMYYFDISTVILPGEPEDPPGMLPAGVTQESISLEIINLNNDVEGLGVSITRVESDVYSDADALLFSTTQAGFYNVTNNAYTGDDIVVEVYAYDTGNPPASITLEIKNGATSIETGTNTASLTISNDPGEIVVGSQTLSIIVRIS